MRFLGALLGVAVGLAQASQEKPLFPTAKGTTWAYAGSFLAKDCSATVVAPEEIDGKSCTVVEWTERGTVSRRFYRVTDDAVTLIATAHKDEKDVFQRTPVDPVVTILKLPLKVGDKWKPTSAKDSPEYTVTATDILKANGKEYTCFVIRTSVVTGDDANHTWWYAAGVGLVMEAVHPGTRSESRLVLKSFGAGK